MIHNHQLYVSVRYQCLQLVGLAPADKILGVGLITACTNRINNLTTRGHAQFFELSLPVLEFVLGNQRLITSGLLQAEVYQQGPLSAPGALKQNYPGKGIR